jgi:hypothetical protein
MKSGNKVCCCIFISIGMWARMVTQSPSRRECLESEAKQASNEHA